MILKIGYTDIEGIKAFRYYEDFSDLRITSFEKKLYSYNLKENKILYDSENEILDTEIIFNPEILKIDNIDIVHVTYIYFVNKQTGHYVSLACLSDSVFLMNDSGKTIDKY